MAGVAVPAATASAADVTPRRAAAAGLKDRLGPLDGLRGLAILLVMWFHTWQISWLSPQGTVFGRNVNFEEWPIDGFVGVDLFFFISGFCLFYPYARTLFDGKAMQSPGAFAYRRIIKIVPSYVLCIAILVATRIATFSSLQAAAWDIGRHLLFVHNLFHDTYGSIDGVMWSLGVEVQFYAVFLAIAWAFMRRPLLAYVVLLCIASEWRLLVAGNKDDGFLYNQLPGVIDLFGSGMFAAYAYRALERGTPRLAARRLLWTGISLAGCFAFWVAVHGCYQTRYDVDWPWQSFLWGRPLECVAFIAMTVGALFGTIAWQRTVANPILIFFSVISYNLYLFHQTLENRLFVFHLPRWRGSDPHLDSAWMLAFTFIGPAVGIAVATFITYAFERPLLRRRPFESFFDRRHAPIPELEALAPDTGVTLPEVS